MSRDWAVVTGGSSGIGQSCAAALAAAGWNVAIQYRRSETEARQTARQIESLGGASLILSADLHDMDQAERLVEGFWNETGGFAAWIHVAGADLLTGPEAKWPFEKKLASIVQVDLMGTILCARAAGRKMKEQGRGSVITMGWDQSATGMEGDSGELFAAVKGGVAAFTRSLAKSLAPIVRVNCVAPGWIKTAWGENASASWQERACREALLARWGSPTDIAHAVEFLVSDRASFITGQTINVNGGVVAS
ncbi:SDR family oxidoreductase [bacterium]|jgi:3-oxoacyl-[acyl-carrier protein] reductase|nr:SDR family oxidoreductase [bacterium]